MKTFKNFITENKTPKTRWLAFDIPHEETEHRSHSKTIEQLKAGELHGVKGISGDKRIVRNFLHTARNALLVMPAHKVHELNPNIRPIEYDNPHSMMKNGMQDIHRILQKNPEDKYGTEQVMGHIFEKAVRHMKQNKIPVEYNMNDGAFNRGQDMHRAMVRANGGKFPQINSPEDFAKHAHAALAHDEQIHKDYNDGKTEEQPILGGAFKHHMREDIKKTFENAGGADKFVHHAVKELGRVYQDEGEHAVDAPSFKIPKKSKLIVLTQHKMRDYYANKPLGMGDYEKKQVNEIDNFHKSIEDLKNHYDVKTIDSSHYEQNRVYSKRPKFKKKPE